MPAFTSTDSGIAASVFLALYTPYAAVMCYIVFKKGFKTVYTMLWFFSMIRFAGQLCGVVSAKIGPQHTNWLIAYLILGAEGYFALIIAAFQFITNAQTIQRGLSWLLTLGPPQIKFSVLTKATRSWAALFHFVLLPANICLIVGGIVLSLASTDEISKQAGDAHTSKVLRTVGQVLFFGMTLVTVLLNIYVYTKERVRNHITISIMVASPFLLVRGLFGILAIYVKAFTYFRISNYQGHGLGANVVIYEYVLSTTMEFVASLCLVSNIFFDDYTSPFVDRTLFGSTDK